MQVDFAIITMREDEFRALADRFIAAQRPQRGASGRAYRMSQIQTKDGKDRTVAIARSAQGPLAAQQLAHDMISDLSPALLLVVGIAGAVPDTDFTLGDVVVSSRIHDFSVNAFKPDKIEWDVQGGIHPIVSEIVASLPMYDTELAGWNAANSIRVPRSVIDKTKFKDFDITKMTLTDKESIFAGQPSVSWQQKILNTLKWHFGDPPQRTAEPLYIGGSIASSGSLMGDTNVLAQWLQEARSIRAIEMEAGGVFQASQMVRYQYPAMAIRGISDIVGLQRDNQWTIYACHSAAAFTYALLTANSEIFDNLQFKPVEPTTSGIASNDTSKSAPTKVPAQEAGGTAPFEMYISYAKKDEDLEEELETHLASLKHQKIISPWHSRQIGLGEEKDKAFDNHINTAQIILLLVSPRFMASNYRDEQEMARAMERHASKQARVIPILLRPTDVTGAPFRNLQGLPRNDEPIVSYRDRDQAWYEIVQEIRKLCEEMQKG